MKAVVTAAPDSFDAGRVDELRSALGSYWFDALLGLLIGECRDRPARLRTALRRNDIAALHAEAHSLKGAATSIGAEALGLVAVRFEQANDLRAAGRLIEVLETTARATLAAAERLISYPPSDRATA